MPKVGNKEFPYTKKGMADAVAYAKKKKKKKVVKKSKASRGDMIQASLKAKKKKGKK